MKLFIRDKNRWFQTSLVMGAMGILAILHFNCAPSKMMAANGGKGTGLSSESGVDYEAAKKSPITLLSSYQLYSSMLSVTGQASTVTANQRAEYTARSGSLAPDGAITNVNAPMQLAATSLAGEMCNGLIAAESANGAVRKFFVGVNFAAGPQQANAATLFGNSINVMARSFWGRDIKDSETALMQSFYTDFVGTAANQAAQTRALYLSACTALLASFDSMTY